jgi:membrane protein implicated in regulation of membrane protease activity
MPRLLVLVLMLATLVALVVQNLSPAMALVIFTQKTIVLPLSAWLLGSVAIGAIATFLLYGLANLAAISPTRRRYRPMGQRIYDPDASATPKTVVAEPQARPRGDSPRGDNSRGDSSRGDSPRSAYDNDWESFRAPERWDDWGQRPDAQTLSQSKINSGYNTADLNDFESGWGESAYDRVNSRDRNADRNADRYDERFDQRGRFSEHPDDRYDDRPDNRPDSRPDNRYDDRPDNRPDNRYEDTVDERIFDDRNADDRNAYSSPANYPPAASSDSDNLGPAQVGPDGVYEADYRVIIPPYKPLEDPKPPTQVDDDEDWGFDDDDEKK